MSKDTFRAYKTGFMRLFDCATSLKHECDSKYYSPVPSSVGVTLELDEVFEYDTRMHKLTVDEQELQEPVDQMAADAPNRAVKEFATYRVPLV